MSSALHATWLAGCATTVLDQDIQEVRCAMRMRLQSWSEDNNFITPLHVAMSLRDFGAVEEWVASQAGTRLNHGPSFMIFCARWGRRQVADMCMDGMACSAEDVDGVSPAGAAPLHVASDHGHVQIARLLLLKRASVDRQKEAPNACAGQTPLVAGNQNPTAAERIIHLLLAARAEATARDSAGRTPLDLAIAWGIPVLVDVMSI